MVEQTQVHGSCLCQIVRFHFTLPTLWCGHCHCSMCRKAHGAGYVTWTGVAADKFVIDQGRQQLKWYATSAKGQRGGCSSCGSIMLFQSEQWPGEMHVALGALDDEIDRKPQINSFFDTHVDWMPIDNSIASKPAPD